MVSIPDGAWEIIEKELKGKNWRKRFRDNKEYSFGLFIQKGPSEEERVSENNKEKEIKS